MRDLGNLLGHKPRFVLLSFRLTMQRPLSEHVARLEERIAVLKRQLRADGLPSYQRDERELDLANAEEALGLFRKAYELEQKISK